MPRFYFDTDDGETSMTDNYGIDLVDEEAARDIAVKTLPDMAQQTLPKEDQQKLAVHVRTEGNVAILDATLSLEVEWKSDAAGR